MRKSEAEVIRKACAWWRYSRPAFWTEADHLAKPAHTNLAKVDEDLATAVAAYLKVELRRKAKRAKRA